MPTGVYIRTEEMRKHISEALKGNKNGLGNKNHLGKHLSEEAKKKISEANKGRIAWNKGKPRLEKTKRKISKTRKGKFIGEDSPRWKGGEKIAKRRKNSKRRSLGFIPLNDFVEGRIAHHINNEEVIYIDEKIHKSISHNVFTGKNMERINAIAYGQLAEDYYYHYLGGD